MGTAILKYIKYFFISSTFIMFRNQYDNDVTTWSPQGRLHQVEYALEAGKQGSAAVGCRSKTHAVLVTRMRQNSDLADLHRKIFRIDDHVAVAMAGLIADGRVLCKYMRNQCMNHKFVYDSDLPTSRLVQSVADKCQKCTQFSSSRPFGVGLLVAGYDRTGAHIYQTCPSGNVWEYNSMAIGSRAQSAKTYLERNFDKFEDLPMDELVRHALLALRESAGSTDLTSDNVAIGVVGKDMPFTMMDEDQLTSFLEAMEAPPADAMQE